MGTQKKALTWVGAVISGLVGLMMVFSAAMKLMSHPDVTAQMVDKFGYPQDLILAIATVEICCVVVYLIPRTAILGAVLLTGYLGGAVATHVRVHDNFLGAAVAGILVWLGVYLRDPRVRALVPLRRPTESAPSN
jgi:hypothetical protein